MMSKNSWKAKNAESTDDLRFTEELCTSTVSISNVSNILDSRLNSTTYGQSIVGNVKKVKQASSEIIQILRKNYGIVLPKAYEDRVIHAYSLYEDDMHADLALRNERTAQSQGNDASPLSMDSDMVEQMHHLTRFRREFALPDGLMENQERASKWTEAELDRGSELMDNIQKYAGRVAEILRLIGDFAESLDLVRIGTDDI
ncbi:hypothetical protein BIW11_09404 [Tropilaelaps mercedesae]|uniref:Uncharacterized protein n=1 Tax=Tropilaelaps mercedesae TaxID=418985 RepID=A0A1V9XKI4_9ACAR|nr:hypothetical protein BIW11_09404 [Tropilaelaps mercedesae]